MQLLALLHCPQKSEGLNAVNVLRVILPAILSEYFGVAQNDQCASYTRQPPTCVQLVLHFSCSGHSLLWEVRSTKMRVAYQVSNRA